MNYIKNFLLFFFPKKSVNIKLSLFLSKYQLSLSRAGWKILKFNECLLFDDIYKILIPKDNLLTIDVDTHKGESINRLGDLLNDPNLNIDVMYVNY